MMMLLMDARLFWIRLGMFVCLFVWLVVCLDVFIATGISPFPIELDTVCQQILSLLTRTTDEHAKPP
jgi:uncharacterized protein YhhL (DUF1145 family)